MPTQDVKKFQKTVWNFYKKHKRDFPWRQTTDPYHILVSEIMLQQTQADRVVSFYKKWLKKFPNVSVLAKADFKHIYPYWQGLGYNRRALNLQKTAKQVMVVYQGKLPKDIALLEKLPGIGPYTARAVAIFAFHIPIACIETNIRRVFIHHFFSDKHAIEDKDILTIAQKSLPTKKVHEWHWALMDYGAYLKSHIPNPNRRHKNYTIQSTFAGSIRQVRGAILKQLMTKNTTETKLITCLTFPPEKIKTALQALTKERLIKKHKNTYALN